MPRKKLCKLTPSTPLDSSVVADSPKLQQRSERNLSPLDRTLEDTALKQDSGIHLWAYAHRALRRRMEKFKLLMVLLVIITPPNLAYAAIWRYTALGDSLASGLGAKGNYGYAERYRDYLQIDNGITVELTNLGVSGWTSNDLLTALKKNSTYRTAVANSDVITFDIGANDFLDVIDDYIGGTCGGKKNNKCLKRTQKRFKTNLKKIIKTIKKLNKKNNVIVRSMNLYFPNTTFYLNNDFVTTDKYPNDFAVINPILTKINQQIRQACRQKKILVADVHLLYNGSSGTEDPSLKGYISADTLHPNDAGYQVIAEGLRNLGYSRSR